MKVVQYSDEAITLELPRRDLAIMLKALSHAASDPSALSETTLEELLGCTRTQARELAQRLRQELQSSGAVTPPNMTWHSTQ